MSAGSPTEEFGPYLVYEKLGVGGMAQVHRAVARNGPHPRPVALKRLLSHIAGSENMVKSFVREARLASYLRHVNVPRTYDLGRVGDIYFIVMELITGRNLREVLRQCSATTGPMPVPVALNILNQICDALDYAHNLCDEHGEPLGIIHRDVSPSNVIVSDTGVVKLIDFGIAKASGRGLQTQGGTLKGKFGYMAPEYIDGHIDARADLFAVGVIAHELLTNRPLFSGRDDIDTLTRVRDMHIDPPSKKNPLVPPEIDDIVMTALARDPDRRWQHATALRTALTTLTHRLDLVATNAQVVEWLDRAFAHAPKQHGHAEADTNTDTNTDTDTAPIHDTDGDTNGSAEQRTVNLMPATRRVMLAMRDSAPPPPLKTPLGTPAYVPAQRASMPSMEPPAAPPSALPPTPSPVPSTARARSSSAAPPSSAAPAASTTTPGLGMAPSAAVQSFRPSAGPMLPASPAAPLVAPLAAPRPSVQSSAAPQLYDPVQSAMVQRGFAQRVSGLSSEPAAPTRRGHALAVVLLVLAAAVAAITVYFLLPLLT